MDNSKEVTKKTDEEYRQYSEMVSIIFELNPDAIVLTTLDDSRIVDCNQEYLNQIGYTRDEVIGRTSIELNLLTSTERSDYVNEIKKNNSVINYEVKVRRKDGSIIFVNYSARFITVNGQQMILNIGHDITRRKKNEADKEAFLNMVQAEKDKLSTLINNIPDEVWFADKNKNFKLANPSALQEFSLMSPELDIEKFEESLEVYRPDGSLRPVDEAPPLRALKGEIVKNYQEIVLTPSSNELRYREVNASPVKDAQNNIIGAVSVVRDITEAKKAEQQIEYQANLLGNVNDAVIGFDSSYRVTYWNQAAEKMFGYTKAEAIGNKSYELLKPVYGKGEREKIFEKLENQGYSEDIVKTHHKNGNEVIVEINSNKFEHNPSLTPGYVAVYRDITQRIQQDERIKKQAKLIDLSFDAIIVAQKDGDIEFWNRGAEELYGYSKDEAIGQPIYRLLLSVFSIPWHKIEERLENGNIWEGEVEHTTKDGSKVIVSSRMQVIKSNDNKDVLFETNHDITIRKRVENHNKKLLEEEQQFNEELTTLNEELQATSEELRTSNEEQIQAQEDLTEIVKKLKISNKELEQFAYVASHDLQEPLRMVSSFTQLLERRYKNKLDQDADDYIDFIVEGAKRMKDLIDDLLAFSRLTNDKELEVILMEVVLEDVLTSLKASIKENNAKITHDKLPTIKGDPMQIHQLLQNLVANAIKFHGDKSPEIHISVDESDEEWVFSVKDNGIGIDPQHQEQIFSIFKRLHTRKDYEGTGIGLSICKRIAEIHGGQIWVSSSKGQGSTFYFSIQKSDKLN